MKLKTIAIAVTLIIIIDCIVSGFAIDLYLTRVAIENDLEVEYKEQVAEKYNAIYNENEKLSDFIEKYWGNEKMIKTYPNLTIMLANGKFKTIKDFYPDIQPYYLKLKK